MKTLKGMPNFTYLTAVSDVLTLSSTVGQRSDTSVAFRVFSLGGVTVLERRESNSTNTVKISGIWGGLMGQLGILVTFIFLLTALNSQAQTVLTISGEVTKSLTLQAADLKAMTHIDVMAKDRDGKEHTYSGIPLADLLKQAGATLGGELRGENLTKYVIIKAVDGYEIIFALPEIDPDFATRTIVLADAVDGAPLAQGVGPYRVVVPGEKKPARWIREVKSMEVRFAN